MAKKSPRRTPPEGGLRLAIENEDWVAIRGTPSELEGLGRLLIEFSHSVGPDHANLDSPGPLFRSGSLGITLYRQVRGGPPAAEPGGAADGGA